MSNENKNEEIENLLDDYYPDDIKELLQSTHPLNSKEMKQSINSDKMPNDFFERIKELSRATDSNIGKFELEVFGDMQFEEELEQVRKEIAKEHGLSSKEVVELNNDEVESEYDEDEFSERINKSNKNGLLKISSRVYIAALFFVIVFLIAFIVYQNNHIKKLTEDLDNRAASISLLQGEVLSLSERNALLMEDMLQEETTEAISNSAGDTTEATSSLPTTYTVVKGDTLTSISRKFYGSNRYIEIIKDANDIANPNALVTGQKLTIPAIN